MSKRDAGAGRRKRTGAPFPWSADTSEGAACPVDTRTCEKALITSGTYDPRAGTVYEYAYRIGDAVYVRIAMTVGGWEWYPAVPKEKRSDPENKR